ncbi:hypothetical protein D9615_002279 [Tricholomella constricta]|uniref:C2H2-type domain-containing protein n=1 Tax=Tricholomella constricta TaxID=117010 RepID=A0A8H5HME1_9AGAR|nr:hypothetical protein D9615_002279 [Tricholomella constricta]
MEVFMYKLRCHDPQCPQTFKCLAGHTNHYRTVHLNYNRREQASPTPAPTPGFPSQASRSSSPLPFLRTYTKSPPLSRASKTLHSGLNGVVCDEFGNTLDPDTPAPPHTAPERTDWAPFTGEVQFKTADFLYRHVEMSASNIDYLLELWALSMAKNNDLGPFLSYQHMYSTIDNVQYGDAVWKCFLVKYDVIWALTMSPGRWRSMRSGTEIWM